MVKQKKTFIDRKNAVTFHLVHRSQHDPLIADENAPQHVLVEAKEKEIQSNAPSVDRTKKREELKKYGVYYDDDYDYLQHMKEHGKDQIVWEHVETINQNKKNRPKIQLPSSVFQTEFEEDEGMLNKAAPRPGPRPDWDPDVVAALDDDFNFDNPENELEDDFVMQAMGDENDDENSFDENDENDNDDDDDVSSDNLMMSDDDDDVDENNDEIMDRLAPLMRNRHFSEEETKSRFTEYSMSSSVMRRNEQLTLLDDRFEKFFETYDDPEVGPLDMEDIGGTWGQKHPLVRQCIKDAKNSKKFDEYNKEWDKERFEKYKEIRDEDDEDFIKIEVKEKEKWDCESILSTYSNIYNHPKLINEPEGKRKSQQIQICPKTGIPINVLNGSDSNKLTVKSLAKFDNENFDKTNPDNLGPKSLCGKSVLSTLSILSLRPKDETPDEKKERKRLLKDYRMERRIEKKANAEAFKNEKKRLVHIKINNQNNMQGNRIL